LQQKLQQGRHSREKGAILQAMTEKVTAVKTTFFGKGAVRMLIPELKKLHIQRAMIVTDSFLYQSGAAKRVGDVLSEAGLEYLVFYKVAPNPTVDIINACIEAVKHFHIELLVALGGGSAIDTAKASSIVSANGGNVEDYEGIDKSQKPGIPIVVVNTTAGTGSECTTYYIVTNPVTHSKMTMVDANCMVSIAVNDIDFMSSMPPKLTAATGMDALTHAIEAVLSINATPFTDKDALWAIQSVHEFLPRAYHNGQDEEARTMMAYAENVAGMAFSNAGLGMVHAMAHALGGRYNLPHGLCNAVLLPYVLTFTAEHASTGNNFCKIAEAMHLKECDQGAARNDIGFQPRNVRNPSDAETKSAVLVIAEIHRLNSELGIASSLKDLKGVKPDDFGSLADLALRDGCMTTNPIQPSKQQVIDTYMMAYNGL
jgi:alcohol dehydrogenase